jgi:hypothetical protein
MSTIKLIYSYKRLYYFASVEMSSIFHIINNAWKLVAGEYYHYTCSKCGATKKIYWHISYGVEIGNVTCECGTVMQEQESL